MENNTVYGGVTVQYFDDFGHGLHRITYVSRSLMPMTPESENIFADLVSASAVNNRSKGITGALLVYDGWFVQTLEGARADIKPLFDRIAADPRHTDVVLKTVELAEKRVFARWGMKQGRRPESIGFDIAAASADELLSILMLSALAPVRRVA